jgi:Phosphate transport (Pho88)
MALNPQITNLVIVLGMMQVSKKIPFDDPQVLLGVRILYVVSNLLIFALYFYVQTRINKKKGACYLWQNNSGSSADHAFI